MILLDKIIAITDYAIFTFGGRCMAHVVNTDECAGCLACVDECPVGAISEDDNGKAVIDADSCTDCGACADVCAFDAISGE